MVNATEGASKPCGLGFFRLGGDGGDGKCAACPARCAHCTNATSCQQCTQSDLIDWKFNLNFSGMAAPGTCQFGCDLGCKPATAADGKGQDGCF